MQRILLAILIICMLSCSEDDALQQTRGTTLVKIDFKDSNRAIDKWTEVFSYNNNGILNKVEDFRSLGRRLQLAYENNRLKEFTTYSIDSGELIFRDSIVYNPVGTIKEIYKFTRNSGIEIPLSQILEFNYDSQNRVSEKKTYFVTIKEYTSIEKYYWSANNIERVEYFNGKGKLYYEYFFTYDDQINYKKGFPRYIDEPTNWSENNITEMNWIDYLGNLDLICRPCSATYQYNLDGLPVSIEFNWGRKLNLSYELELTRP